MKRYISLLEKINIKNKKKIFINKVPNILDLIDVLYDEVNELNGLYPYRENLKFDLIDTLSEIKVDFGYADPKELKKLFGKNRVTSINAVNKYFNDIKKGIEYDPVFISDSKFLDGGHRAEAYIKANKKEIPVINLQSLLNLDWKKFEAGEI